MLIVNLPVTYTWNWRALLLGISMSAIVLENRGLGRKFSDFGQVSQGEPQLLTLGSLAPLGRSGKRD